MSLTIIVYTLTKGLTMPVCKKCQNLFPPTKVIDGKRRNLRKRSYCLECSPFNSRNRKILENYGDDNTKKCPMCDQFKPNLEFYQCTNKISCYCKTCSRIESRLRQLKFKKECTDYKGGCCCECKEDSLVALDFHHLDPEAKEFSISDVRFYKMNDDIKKELDKCILLCSNCHRKEHGKQFMALLHLI
jgi:hypothetical protein